MVKQASLFAGLGASVRIRTFAYDAARWDSRVGAVPVDALRARIPGRRPPSVPRFPSDRRVAWLLADLAGAITEARAACMPDPRQVALKRAIAQIRARALGPSGAAG